MLRQCRRVGFRWYRQLRSLPIRETSRPALRRDRRRRSRRVRRGTGGQSPIASGKHARSTQAREAGIAAAASHCRRKIHPRYSPVQSLIKFSNSRKTFIFLSFYSLDKESSLFLFNLI